MKIIDKNVCIVAFYTKASPKQGTILDLIIHLCVFYSTTHRYTRGINEV